MGMLPFASLMPARQETIAKHKLVGLMWQQAALIADPAKKRVLHAIGLEYGLKPDAVSKWEKPCRRKLGDDCVTGFLAKARELETEWYYAAVFGAWHGPTSLSQCVAAYQLAKKAAGVSETRGKPKKIKA
jgi:hypothetical protein